MSTVTEYPPQAEHLPILRFAGDLARWAPDGQIQILGRVDRQVGSLDLQELLCNLSYLPRSYRDLSNLYVRKIGLLSTVWNLTSALLHIQCKNAVAFKVTLWIIASESLQWPSPNAGPPPSLSARRMYLMPVQYPTSSHALR